MYICIYIHMYVYIHIYVIYIHPEDYIYIYYTIHTYLDVESVDEIDDINVCHNHPENCPVRLRHPREQN